MGRLPQEGTGIMGFDFRSWILNQEQEDYHIIQDDSNTIRLVTDYGTATVCFHELEDSITIVEFSIVANKDGDVKFYLHFQMNDEEHCRQLFHEMTETLIDLKNQKTVEVLLSCSSGLTTAMFAEHLNSTAKLLGLDMHFNAVPYLSIFEEAEQYDVIMLAPQIGYLWNRLKDTIPDKPVLKIPTAVFAAYDAVKAIQFVMDEQKEFYEKKKEEKQKEHCCACDVKSKTRILSIIFMPNKQGNRIYYRVYNKGELIDKNRIVRPVTAFEDIDHIVDTVLARHQKLDMIGVSVPGIVNDLGEIKLTGHAVYPMKKHLEEKYGIEVLVDNNVNTAVIGFSLEHPEYKNILFHSQPYGNHIGGQGILLNGELVTGKNGLSGEVKFFINRMQLSDEPSKLIWEEAGALELVTKSILPAIALFGPEAIAVRSNMTPDIRELKKKLNSFIPEEYLPEFFSIQDASSYMLDGQMKRCVDALERKSGKES